MSSVRLRSDGAYEPIYATGQSDGSPYAAFSSKLYSTGSELATAGLRVMVKDLYSLKGIKTSGGNRAYYATYSARNESAKAIQRIVCDISYTFFIGKLMDCRRRSVLLWLD